MYGISDADIEANSGHEVETHEFPHRVGICSKQDLGPLWGCEPHDGSENRLQLTVNLRLRRDEIHVEPNSWVVGVCLLAMCGLKI